jgi:serine/threonine-protein kinase
MGPLLGRGGMGDVHEAWDVVLCRTVALKMLKNLEPPALIRFMHEAQIHARLVHPNICRIYDVDNYEGTLRVAMQLVRGPNLEQVCRELSLQEVVTLMALVAQAVHLVHRLNLIHRDLKPSNILLERNSEGQWIPFVCDFGLAMALDDPPLTYSHGVLGTPAYMAPEQFQGERNRITAATDVFALGGTLHYALTCRPPSSPFSVKGAGDPPLPRDLRLIIAKCLQPDPEHRYATASALAEDLWRYLEGSPIRASVRTTLSRIGFWGRKEFRAIRPYLLALATGALVGAGWLAHWHLARDANRRQMRLVAQCMFGARDLASAFRRERALPVHDLRPAYARIRDHLETLQSQCQELAPEWRSRGHYALGSSLFLVHRYPAARAELEQAWDDGFRSPWVASLLARAAITAAQDETEEALFRTGLPPRVPDPALARAETFLRKAQDPAADPDATQDALLAFLHRDYRSAAATSRADHLSFPWHYESAVLEAQCRTALAREAVAEGDLDQAKAVAREAVAAARGALAVGQSDPDLYHAYFLANRLLAGLLLDTGNPPPAFFTDLQATSTQALRLDPEDPRLQDDWLALHWLEAIRLMDLGLSPEAQLAAAVDFLDTWGREPLTPALRADRMVIHWLLAEQAFTRRGDPGPHLAEALGTAGHTPFLLRDYYWNLLNLKARAELARGSDPRPTLDLANAGFQDPLQEGSNWSLKEAAAEAWLIRAEWEAGHGQDPGASLRNARLLAENLRHQVPGSAAAHALEGLAEVLECRAHPRDQAPLLARARVELRLALARDAHGPYQNRLKRALQDRAAR